MNKLTQLTQLLDNLGLYIGSQEVIVLHHELDYNDMQEQHTDYFCLTTQEIY